MNPTNREMDEKTLRERNLDLLNIRPHAFNVIVSGAESGDVITIPKLDINPIIRERDEEHVDTVGMTYEQLVQSQNNWKRRLSANVVPIIGVVDPRHFQKEDEHETTFASFVWRGWNVWLRYAGRLNIHCIAFHSYAWWLECITRFFMVIQLINMVLFWGYTSGTWGAGTRTALYYFWSVAFMSLPTWPSPYDVTSFTAGTQAYVPIQSVLPPFFFVGVLFTTLLTLLTVLAWTFEKRSLPGLMPLVGARVNEEMEMINLEGRHGTSRSNVVRLYIKKGGLVALCLCVYLSHALFLPCLNGLLSTATRVFFANDAQTWVYAVFAVIYAIVLVFLYLLYTVIFFEWRSCHAVSASSFHLLSKNHAMLDVVLVAGSTVMMITLQIFAALWDKGMLGIGGQYAYLAICILIFATIVSLTIYWTPYYHGLGNWGALTSNLLIWFGSIIALFTTIFNSTARSDVPIYVWLGMIAASCILGFIAKSRIASITVRVGHDKSCGTAIDLEIASRYLARNEDEMEECNKLFEANQYYYPNSSHFHLSWASFLCIHAQNPCAALYVLSKIQHQYMPLGDRFQLYILRDYCIHFLERHTSREAQLMSIEKARRFESECKRLILTYWNLLNTNNVEYLSDIASAIGRAIERTENVYRIMLSREPSPQTYFAYAKFLDQVVNDPENARHFTAVAEHLQTELPQQQDGQSVVTNREKRASVPQKANSDIELKTIADDLSSTDTDSFTPREERRQTDADLGLPPLALNLVRKSSEPIINVIQEIKESARREIPIQEIDELSACSIDELSEFENYKDDEDTYSFLSDDHYIHDPLNLKNESIGAHHVTTSALIRTKINEFGAAPRVHVLLGLLCALLFVIMVAMFAIVAGSLGNTGNQVIMSNFQSFMAQYTVPLIVLTVIVLALLVVKLVIVIVTVAQVKRKREIILNLLKNLDKNVVKNVYNQLKIRDFLHISNHRQHADVLSSMPAKTRPPFFFPVFILFTLVWMVIIWVIYGTSLGIQNVRYQEVKWSNERFACAPTNGTSRSCYTLAQNALLYGNPSLSLPGSLNRYSRQDQIIQKILSPNITDSELLLYLSQSTGLYVEEAQFDAYVMLNILLFFLALSTALFVYFYYSHVVAIVHMLHTESYVNKCMLLTLPNSVLMSNTIRHFLLDEQLETSSQQKISPELQNVIDSCVDMVVVFEYKRAQGRVITFANTAITTACRSEIVGRPLTSLFANMAPIEQAEENCRNKSLRQTFLTTLRCGERNIDVSISMGFAGTDSNSFILFAKQTDIIVRDQVEQEQRSRIKQLLYFNVPQPLTHRLENGANTAVQTYHWVTVIVIRLYDFDALVDYKGEANTVSPKKMIESLQLVHTAFDELAVRYRIRKLHTHGLDYVCCSDVFTDQESATSENSTMESMDFCTAIIDAMSHLAQVVGREKIDVKIGVHTGPLTISVRKSTVLNHASNQAIDGPFTLDAYGEALQGSTLLVEHCDVDRIHISMGVYVRVYNMFMFEQVTSEARVVNKDYRLSMSSISSEDWDGEGVLEFSYYLLGKKTNPLTRSGSAVVIPKVNTQAAIIRKTKTRSKRLSVYNHQPIPGLEDYKEEDESTTSTDTSSEEESLTARTIKI